MATILMDLPFYRLALMKNMILVFLDFTDLQNLSYAFYDESNSLIKYFQEDK